MIINMHFLVKFWREDFYSIWIDIFVIDFHILYYLLVFFLNIIEKKKFEK